MTVQYFAIRIETHRVVAAEIPDRSAAALLDAGQPVLLGTKADLSKLATRLHRPLLTISCSPARSAARRGPMPARVFHLPHSPAVSGARAPVAQGEERFPASTIPADDRLPCVPAVRLA